VEGGPAGPPQESTTTTAGELALLSQELLQLSRDCAAAAAAAAGAMAGGGAGSRRRVLCCGESLAAPDLAFLWPLLPPYVERPLGVAAMATAARGPGQALRDVVGGLCVGHLHVHPNTVRDPVSPSGTPPSETRSPHDDFNSGCLRRVSFGALVSVQFHLPRLSEVMWLLEGFAASRCHSLRKLVDRQSRWRPREQRFETLDEAGRARAAAVMDALGGSSLPSLRHLEGPVFSLLLRARGVAAAAPRGGAEVVDAATAAAVARGVVTEEGAHLTEDALEPAMASGNAPATPPALAPPPGGGLGERLETAHLVDSSPQDLLGLWEPLYPRLQKLVLLNLPATAPGRTAAAVAEFLPRAPALAELTLDFQFFDPAVWELDALEAFVECVQAPPSKVTKLMMEWCRLGDAGARCVCQALARHHSVGSVTELSLAHCELRDASSVCEMLETPGLPLTKLDLSSNSLDDRQACTLAKSLPHSKVKELRLRDSQISVQLPVKTEWFWGC